MLKALAPITLVCLLAIPASGQIFYPTSGGTDEQISDALTISGGTVNSSVIGGVTPAAGTFTTLGVNTSLTAASAATLGWSDGIIARDSANAIAQRNSTNGQFFRVYGTYTDSSNYVRVSTRGGSSFGSILLEGAGTGVGGHNFTIGNALAGSVIINTDATARWQWQSAGHFIPQVTSTYDAGSSSNRVRRLYADAHLPAIVSKTITYAALTTDHTLLCDATASAFDIDLPAASTATGLVLVIKKVDASVNAVSIDPNGTELIDGSSTSVAISTQWQCYTIQCNGTSWFVIGVSP